MRAEEGISTPWIDVPGADSMLVLYGDEEAEGVELSAVAEEEPEQDDQTVHDLALANLRLMGV